jgi:two-component system CheB/CheR fusion protein
MGKMMRWMTGYGMAVLAVATGIAFLLIPEVGKGFGSILYLAVLVAAWYGGLGPGLFATTLITVAAVLNLVFGPDFTASRVVGIVLFVGGGVLITLVVEALHAARRRVETSQQWLSAVLTSIGDAVIATDAQGRTTFLNPVAETLTGWQSSDAVGRSLTDVFQVVAEETRESVDNPVARVLRENTVVGLANHTVLIAKDGTERPIDDSGAPIKEKGGATTGVVLVFRDITDRKHLEHELQRRLKELAEADRRKDEFLAMLAHELRNPLAAISSAVQVTTLTAADQEIGDSMEVINRQVKHLARLIDDLFDVSRITRGKIQLRKERLDVGTAVRGAIESARPLIEARQHNLAISVPARTLPAEADPVRLEQILTNLLTNAAKYTESGGQIGLSAEQEGDAIVIKVRDTGMGIPPDQLARIFDLFAQGDRSLARSEGGLGIGLTLARSLAELHGGSLTATSAGFGKGSEFVVRLPAASPSCDGPVGTKSPVPPGSRRGARVLVIDDNVDMARGLASLLKLLNYEVWTAYDGRTGLEAARGHRPEVVLLDIGLPGLDGYQVAEQLRREDFGKDMLLIAVTGYGNEEDRQQARSAGFDHFVTKPVDYATLVALMMDPASAAPLKC